MMINVRIENITDGIHIGGKSNVRLPPPFHTEQVEPGGHVDVACKAEQMEDQWPKRSGFSVADLLQQLVKQRKIRVKISPIDDSDKNDGKIREIDSVINGDGVLVPKPIRDYADKSENKESSVMSGDGAKNEDDLPDMVDPLYSTPSDHKPKSQASTGQSEPPPQTGGDSGIDLPDHTVEPESKGREDHLKDGFNSALRMAFIGAGQGGGRIAQSFCDLGYRKVCVVNTTDQDMTGLTVPNKLVIGNNRGGAGKDPEQGRAAAEESFEDIMDLLMRSWGEHVDQMFVCVGGGGGSGTGSWPVIVRALKEYAASTNIEKPISQHLGIIMTMPKRSEGSRVQANALAALEEAIAMAEVGDISSLIVVDNAKVHDLYPGLPVKKFWKVANQNFAAIFHTFNLLAAKDSEFNTFDVADFKSVLRNGLMIFGMTKVDRWAGKEDISQAVRQNLSGSLLADGFELSKADMAGAIVVAHDEVLEEVPMEYIDYAFNSLGRCLGNEGITLHNGIYEGKQPGMRVFTIVSGLGSPKSRLDDLNNLSK